MKNSNKFIAHFPRSMSSIISPRHMKHNMIAPRPISTTIISRAGSNHSMIIVSIIMSIPSKCHTRFWKANRMRTMYVPGSEIHVHNDYINDSS
jgi:hypothetical protein